jgi:glycosyltransferase involved in cell wall biosynthesis
MEKLNILQVFNQYRSFGGEELVVENIDRMLSPYHHMSKCLFSSSDWAGSEAPSKISQAWLMFNNPKSRKQLREKVAEQNPNALLLHNIYPIGSPGIYDEALDMNLPVIQYIHNFRPFSVGSTLWVGDRIAEESLQGNFWAEICGGAWQNSKVKSALFALVMKYLHARGLLLAVRKWIAISEFMRSKFIEAGIPPEDIVTLLHPWEMKSGEITLGDDGYYLFLGRLVEEKGVRVLLSAWEILEQEMGSSCPVLMIGGEGELEAEVIRAAEVSDKIKLGGFLAGERKRDAIAGCRAMLAPSVWWEPLGLVTYEAYDDGKPMLAANSGGLSETVLDGRTGYTHEPADAQGLAESVMKLEADSPNRRREMGHEGRSWLAAHADPDVWRDKMSTIIRSVTRT